MISGQGLLDEAIQYSLEWQKTKEILSSPPKFKIYELESIPSSTISKSSTETIKISDEFKRLLRMQSLSNHENLILHEFYDRLKEIKTWILHRNTNRDLTTTQIILETFKAFLKEASKIQLDENKIGCLDSEKLNALLCCRLKFKLRDLNTNDLIQVGLKRLWDEKSKLRTEQEISALKRDIDNLVLNSKNNPVPDQLLNNPVPNDESDNVPKVDDNDNIRYLKYSSLEKKFHLPSLVFQQLANESNLSTTPSNSHLKPKELTFQNRSSFHGLNYYSNEFKFNEKEPAENFTFKSLNPSGFFVPEVNWTFFNDIDEDFKWNSRRREIFAQLEHLVLCNDLDFEYSVPDSTPEVPRNSYVLSSNSFLMKGTISDPSSVSKNKMMKAFNWDQEIWGNPSEENHLSVEAFVYSRPQDFLTLFVPPPSSPSIPVSPAKIQPQRSHVRNRTVSESTYTKGYWKSILRQQSDSNSIQQRLNNLWERLQTTSSQEDEHDKIQVALKLSNTTVDQPIISQLEQTATMIEVRETFLTKLQEFENKKSNPLRLFEENYSIQLQQDNQEREEIRSKLGEINMMLYENLKQIKRVFGIDLKYKGIIYEAKMKHDESNTLYVAYKAFKE